jgi:lipoyl(octanoyl) transferase
MKDVEWRIDDGLIDYPIALKAMEERAQGIRDDKEPELIWLLQHPPLYTGGTSAKQEDLINADGLPVYQTGRGGQYTWHGPGQRVAYVLLDLNQRGRDVRRYVQTLEDWIIDCLAQFNVKGQRRKGRVGIWVERPDKGLQHEDKIAAIGVRITRWVTWHGLAINVDPDLSGYAGIVPCGIDAPELGVTSLADLGVTASLADVDLALKSTFTRHFTPSAP